MRIYFKHDLTATLVIFISSWPQLLYTLKRQTPLLGGECFRSLLYIYFPNIMDRRHLFLKPFVFFYIYIYILQKKIFNPVKERTKDFEL